MYNAWLEVANKVLDKVRNEDNAINLNCPKCKNNAIEYQYYGNPETMIGYLNIWCKECQIGIHISRIKIPDNAHMISFDNVQEDHLPFKPLNLVKTNDD